MLAFLRLIFSAALFALLLFLPLCPYHTQQANARKEEKRKSYEIYSTFVEVLRVAGINGTDQDAIAASASLCSSLLFPSVLVSFLFSVLSQGFLM